MDDDDHQHAASGNWNSAEYESRPHGFRKDMNGAHGPVRQNCSSQKKRRVDGGRIQCDQMRRTLQMPS